MATVLAVDDAKLMREMVKTILESEGHEVVLAEDGVDALEKAKTISPQLVLTDVNMPKMNGIALVGELRKLANYATTPILMLTTESADYKKEKARGLGANGWLKKPFDPPRLMTAVNKMLA